MTRARLSSSRRASGTWPRPGHIPRGPPTAACPPRSRRRSASDPARARLRGTRGRERLDERLQPGAGSMTPSSSSGWLGGARGEHVRLEPLSDRPRRGRSLAVARGPRETYRFTTVPDTEDEMAQYVATALEQQAARRAVPTRRWTGRAAAWWDRHGSAISSSGPGPRGHPLQRGEEVPMSWRSAGRGWPPTSSERQSTRRQSS